MIHQPKSVTLGALRLIEPKKPKSASKLWTGIRHYDLLKEVVKMLPPEDRKSCEIAVSKDWQDVIFCFPKYMPYDDSGNYVGIGFSNSNARRHSIRGYLAMCTPEGSYVYRRYEIGKRRSSHFDLRGWLRPIVEALLKDLVRLGGECAALSEKCLMPDEAKLLFHKIAGTILPWSHVGVASDSFFAQPPEEQTWMGFALAISRASRLSSPMIQMDRQLDARSVIIAAYNQKYGAKKPNSFDTID